ncbi:MAG: bifunctional phosphopantothenoylcysteine decarboxylase/phosphopantothenate--cysteine ligase CoaBC [Burkholderiales bacterium]|nr:bifunctional phosphopantothenoylcysteine decarboxylase/phosphopantothenate--cysteine ligase CoaBC [Burkholderiales bacterium]
MTSPAPLRDRHIVLGITGGVAAYKAAELVRLLVQDNIGVQVVMTAAATRFVTPATFQALSGRSVFVDLWDDRVENGMAHIDLSREAAAILVAPASADFLAKLAHGNADDLLSTLCLARDCPLLVAPAMNRQMWEHPATQRNAAQLAADGVTLLGPAAGDQACGEVGMGRMLEAAELHHALVAFFVPRLLAGRRVLLTAGPTQEAIDPVRVITNLSSGKMGYALARACAEAGAAVTLVSGPTALATPPGVERIDVMNAAGMLAAVESQLPGQDIFIGVAAVADYTVANPSAVKHKKGDAPLKIELAPTVDILARVAAGAHPPFCVGFAAESENVEANAEVKRRKKGVPLLVANRAQDALGSDTNAVTLIDDSGRHPLPSAPKLDVARRIVAHIAGMLAAAGR